MACRHRSAQRHTIPLPAIPSVEHPLCGRMRGFDRLDDFEPFEFRVAECERLALASVLMGSAELFRLGPCRKILLRRPYCMRRIEHMVVALRTPQQVKCPEALDLVEMRLTRHPQILEGFAFLLDDLETVHGDEHF
jgi:hypothetical protein